MAGHHIEKRWGSGAVMADDIVCLQSVHTSKHLDAQGDEIRARWNDCGEWQSMKLEKEVAGALFSGSFINLLAHTGKRIEVDPSGSVHAHWSEKGIWQTFAIENYGGRNIVSGDAVFLKAHTGALVHVEQNVVRAKWNEYGNWQRFIIESKRGNGPIMPGSQVFLRAHTGKMIDVEGVMVQARFSDKGLWQSLTVEKSTSRRLTAVPESSAEVKSDKEQEEYGSILMI